MENFLGVDKAAAGEPANKNKPAGGEEIFRPAVRSMWFLFFGLLLGPAIIFFGRDPDGHPAKWIALSLLSLGLIVHRLSLKYTIDGGFLKASSWWGLKPDESLSLAWVADVRASQGFTGRLAGCGHVEIRSVAADETAIIMLGQPEPLRIVEKIETAAARARARLDVSA